MAWRREVSSAGTGELMLIVTAVVVAIGRNTIRVQPFSILYVFETDIELHLIVKQLLVFVTLGPLVKLLNTIVWHTVDL